jgi:tRNA (adenine37-N6)-methyltransferase
MTVEPIELLTGGPATFGLVPIGRAETTWSRGDCPKNMRAARESGQSARLVIDSSFREGLKGIERASHLIVLGWFDQVDRDVLVQRPKHLAVAQGCFSLRSPARPNPIGLSIVRQIGIDMPSGTINIDALDWFDGTLLLDIKPYYPSTDLQPSAEVREP